METGESAVNDKWAEMLGYRLDEVDDLTEIASKTFHPDDRDRVERYNQRSAAGEIDNYEIEYRVVTKQGETRRQHSKGGTMRRDQQGQAVRFVGTVLDITERKKAERQLQDAYDVISSSIEYASNLQRATLPIPELFDIAYSDHLVIWEPRDRVGGDIYWLLPVDDGFLLGLADCTGHGVPGAFITLLASSALRVAIAEESYADPARVIASMNRFIKAVLAQYTDDATTDDGLELGLCHIGGDGGTVSFAGARFSLWVAENNEMREVKGGKSGIGYKDAPLNIEFNNHILEASETATFYLFSDGFTDQIGGDRRRGFGKRRMIDQIVGDLESPMATQRDNIIKTFSLYQGDELRRDDITMIGFRPMS